MSSSDSGKAARPADDDVQAVDAVGGVNVGRPIGGVSLADVAAEASVSRMTVSRVLREAGGVSAETRSRVLDVARRLGHVPDRIAAAFGSEAANPLVGVALPTLGRDLYAQILEGLEGRLATAAYQPMVGVVGHDDEVERRWLMSVLAWRPAGLIVAGRPRGEAARALLASLSVPVVEIWNLGDTARARLDTDPLRVGFDHYRAGRQMGEHLAARYGGPVGYVGARPEGAVLGGARLEGFRDAFASSGEVTTLFLNDRSSFYSGYYGTEQILSGNPGLRVLYYLDDAMAVGGLMLCQKKGLKIPGDVAIAGFGGTDIGSVLPSRLTTTTTFRLRIGKLAAENLLKRIEGRPVSVVQDVGFELVKGETA